MDWKPKAWIAATLGFFLPPLGFLYVVKPWYALFYFLLSVLLAVLDLARLLKIVHVPPYWFQFTWILMLLAAFHCYRLAASGSVTTKRAWYSRWLALISVVWIYFVATFVLRSFFYEPFRLPSASMYPAMEEGRFFLIKKLGYGNYGAFGISLLRTTPSAPILRGDVMVFRLPTNEATSYVKRVIGVPGDHLVLQNRRLTLNGKPVPTTCEKTPAVEFCTENLDGTSFLAAYAHDRYDTDFEFVVPQGHYFMLGDNRNNSQDSRFLGPILADKIVGRVVYVF